MASDLQHSDALPELSANPSANAGEAPDIVIVPAVVRPDYATILGLCGALAIIAGVAAMGGGNASFFDFPAFLIVICGTMAATSVSYTWEELKAVPSLIRAAFTRKIVSPRGQARQLLDIAVTARKRGVLILSKMKFDGDSDKFLSKALQMAADGFSGEEIDRVLGQELAAGVERARRSASILRRAAEIAPAMGLIGTLIGLVQMLAHLETPATIGPAMALALLTTFYGAITGMVILAPLGAKLERNANTEATLQGLVLTAIGSILRQENPRRLEMLLNSELPPDEQVVYFD
jgi:chemotaxis protein MotA